MIPFPTRSNHTQNFRISHPQRETFLKMGFALPPYLNATGASRYQTASMCCANPPASATPKTKKSKPQRSKRVWSKIKKFFHHQQRPKEGPEQGCQDRLTEQSSTFDELDAEEVIQDAGESAMYGWDEHGRWTDSWMFHELDRRNGISMGEDCDPHNLRATFSL